VSLTDPPQPPEPSPALALAVARTRRIPRQPAAYEAGPATAAWSSQHATGGGSQPAAGGAGADGAATGGSEAGDTAGGGAGAEGAAADGADAEGAVEGSAAAEGAAAGGADTDGAVAGGADADAEGTVGSGDAAGGAAAGGAEADGAVAGGAAADGAGARVGGAAGGEGEEEGVAEGGAGGRAPALGEPALSAGGVEWAQRVEAQAPAPRGGAAEMRAPEVGGGRGGGGGGEGYVGLLARTGLQDTVDNSDWDDELELQTLGSREMSDLLHLGGGLAAERAGVLGHTLVEDGCDTAGDLGRLCTGSMVRYGFGPDEAAMVERELGRAAQHRRRGQPAGRRPALGIRNPGTGAPLGRRLSLVSGGGAGVDEGALRAAPAAGGGGGGEGQRGPEKHPGKQCGDRGAGRALRDNGHRWSPAIVSGLP
jgi:hypothetical protein